MFENKTYENIMAEMMEEMPDNVDTREGSLIYNACAKQALQLEKAYLLMQTVEDNMYTSDQDEEHLILNGQDKGLPIKEATKAVVRGVFSQEIDIGTRFNAGALNYTCMQKITDFDYRMECEEAGSIGNITGSQLSPIDFVENYQGGMIAEVLISGADREDIEIYRQRILALNDIKYFGGNREDYRRFIGGIDGVGAVKVQRRSAADDFIYPIILSADYGIPTDIQLERVQEIVDPETSHGEGDGIAPIGHKVLLKKAENAVIDIVCTIVYEEGYDQTSLQSYINEAVDEYFLELARQWADASSLVVRISQIESRLLKIEGIIDVGNTFLCGEQMNVILDYNEIPKRGTVNGV